MKRGPLISLLLLTAACATVPFTGRKQLAVIPRGRLAAISDDGYRQLLEESELITTGEELNALREVGRNIAASAEEMLSENRGAVSAEEFRWEFNLIKEDKVVNAFCLPGGKVAFYSGIMKVTGLNRSRIAAVMGHEVAHVIARHGNERMSQLLMVRMGGMALERALAEEPGMTGQLFLAAYGAGTQLGILLPYSRKHELEADRIGLMIMNRAGYDMEEAVVFWQKMQKTSGEAPPEFLSTHPAPETRINRIRKLIEQIRK